MNQKMINPIQIGRALSIPQEILNLPARLLSCLQYRREPGLCQDYKNKLIHIGYLYLELNTEEEERIIQNFAKSILSIKHYKNYLEDTIEGYNKDVREDRYKKRTSPIRSHWAEQGCPEEDRWISQEETSVLFNENSRTLDRLLVQIKQEVQDEGRLREFNEMDHEKILELYKRTYTLIDNSKKYEAHVDGHIKDIKAELRAYHSNL